uniref:Ig-like domain-containing protein n=1 Tax=Cyclopterus lumpus TaxID=8103 RepID=A0A8C2X243_CYCLU
RKSCADHTLTLWIGMCPCPAVSEGSTVVGQAGGDVTLSCKYDIHLYGVLSVCWGRGSLPTSGCSGRLVTTDGPRVTEETRASSRYQLLGALEAGDVSLTIRNVSAADGGRYGCRVDVPGWFNDDKHHFDLLVEDAPQTTTTSTSTSTSTALPRETVSNATGTTRDGRSFVFILFLQHTERIHIQDCGGGA